MKILASALRSLLLLGIPFQLGATTIFVDLGGADCAPAGLCTAQPGATTVTFDGLSGTTPSPYTFGIATYSWTGSSAPFVQGSQTGSWAAPVGDTTDYLTIGSPARPSSVTIDFSTPIRYFGFYMGSPDTYNNIAFYGGPENTLIQSFAGNELINPGDGSWTAGDFVNFWISDGTVSKIVMSSSIAAFETDNHAFTDLPEPGSLGLMFTTLAMVFVGRQSFRRTRS